MANTIIPVGNEVKGDITQCKIETVRTKVERSGSLSFTQKESFTTYDVCTKAIVKEYSNQSLTATGFFGMTGLVIIGFCILAFIWGIIFDY